MQVDGRGERPLVDAGGFSVVWTNGPCQDPNQGGTNCYGPGDVLYDAYDGTAYQIGSDWHVRTLGDQPSSSAPAAEPAPVMVDHFYYVDGGAIVEKTAYSDGTAAYSDTGLRSSLGDGTASGDPYSLATAAAPQAGAPPSSSDTGGGFQTPNDVGGYGPYATPDPPILRDAGTYADGGRLIHHQVDQYGNDYWTDVGAAPAGARAAATTPVYQVPAPNVPTPRPTPPSVYQPGPSVLPSVTTYPAPRIGAPQFGTAPTTSPPNVSTSGQQGPSGAPATRGGPVVSGGAPAITPTGNAQQWAHQAVNWLSKASFIGGVPNGVLALGGYVGYSMLRRRRAGR